MAYKSICNRLNELQDVATYDKQLDMWTSNDEMILRLENSMDEIQKSCNSTLDISTLQDLMLSDWTDEQDSVRTYYRDFRQNGASGYLKWCEDHRLFPSPIWKVERILHDKMSSWNEGEYKRDVYVGVGPVTSSCGPELHKAVHVGSQWWEVRGWVFNASVLNLVNEGVQDLLTVGRPSPDEDSPQGSKWSSATYMGKTGKTDVDIYIFSRDWVVQNPYYPVANCRHYSTALIKFLNPI